MATIVRQLKEAGVAVPPLIQRVWQWVKDNGKHTSTEVALAINAPKNNVSSTLGILCDRGMMTRVREHSKALGHDVTYYTAASKLKKYELLSLTQEARDRPKRKSAKAEVAAGRQSTFTQAGTANLVPVEVTPPPNLLDTMNVRQAYALYQELYAMFNQGAKVD